MKILIIIALFLLIIRFGRGYYQNRTPRPPMEVVKIIGNNIQIRKLPEQIFASITVQSTETKATYSAFNALGSYIFGNNISKTSVAMTAPVITQKTSETIAMTAPVITQQESEGNYEVSFVMPSGYTMETLPIPNNKNVRLRVIPSKTIAVISFGGYATQGRIDSHRDTLVSQLKASGITSIGETIVAQYNDPRTPPMMRTNEIWLEVTSGW